MDFEDFITTRKQCVKEAQKLQDGMLQIVLGNESCDLDSAVGALAYAFLLQRQYGGEVIPVLNVPRYDYSLKTEVAFLLNKYKIKQSDLVFIDDLELLRSKGQVSVHLVDHNIPTDSQADLAYKVLSIVDHHNQDCHDSEKIFIRIETVASACTLITDLFYQRLNTVPSDTVAHLLRATILGDSICLSEEAGKVRPLDTAMIQELEKQLNITSTDDRAEVFRQICSAKENVSGLTTDQLLRKDAKKFTVHPHCVFMSSLMVHIKVLFARDDVMSSFSSVLHNQQASLLAVICSCGKDGVSSKHFILYSHDSSLHAKVMEMVDKDRDLDFSANLPEFPDTDNLSVRKFNNIKISRKQVLPKLKEFVTVITTSDDLVAKLRADSDQLTFSLELSAPGTPAVLESPAPEFYSSHENSGSHTPNPSFHVEAPPNSYMDPSILEQRGAFLPSFNSSEMVQRIMIKKNQIGSDHMDEHSQNGSSENTSGHNSCPFTPANSFVDRLPAEHYDLPSFNSREMVNRMLQKKQLISTGSGDASPITDETHLPEIFTPHTSECEADYAPDPCLDESDLERRLSTVEGRDVMLNTADNLVGDALAQAINKVRVSED